MFCFNSINLTAMEDSAMIGEYKIIAKIGEGSFGQIYEVTKDDKIYAIKTVVIF